MAYGATVVLNGWNKDRGEGPMVEGEKERQTVAKHRVVMGKLGYFIKGYLGHVS